MTEPASLPGDGGPAAASARRHDLDALRAFAMLLGIVLHVALSFTLITPWLIRDTRRGMPFDLLVVAIHGFRMPLFFVVSGFFTAMMWRRRGLRGLLRDRARRILLPCLLGLVTIVPTMNLLIPWVAAPAPAESPVDDGSLVAALRLGDMAEVGRRLEAGADPSAADPELGVTPLGWAALLGRVEAVDRLVERGADLNGRNRDGATPLHAAAFAGQAGTAERLLRNGAKADAVDRLGSTPLDTSRTDWETSEFIAGLLGLSLGTRDDLERDRAEFRAVVGRLAPETVAASASARPRTGSDPVARYRRWLTSGALTVELGGRRVDPFWTPIFHHLWFLWFLVWLVPMFAAAAWLRERTGWRGPPRGLVVAPARFLWLVPLTLVPQWFMGLGSPMFGPDTSEGILPQPHVLLYYAIFFGFGAAYHEGRDDEGRLGRWWWLSLPTAVLLALPVGLATINGPHAVTCLAQVLYAWLMSVGLLGLFRRALPAEDRAVRYVSDSSYWLYLVHVPLVFVAQRLVRDWPLPAGLKFPLVCAVLTAILLASYQAFVRHTWIGTLLNGPRTRRPAAAALVSSEASA